MVVQSQFIEMFGNTPLSLGDFFSMKAGKSITAEDIKLDQEEDLYPCYGGNGVRGYVTSYTHEGDTVLIGRQGALCGNVQIARNKFYATEHAVVVTPKTPVNISWLYYALKSMELNQYARGVAQPGLAVGQLEKLPFVLPSMKSQNEFARVSHQADKSKFGGLKSQFIEMFGGIQNGRKWPLKKLSEICHLVNGYAFKSALYSNEGFSVIRIANVQKGYIDNSDRAYYPVSFEKEFKDSILQKGDILISLTGNVGRVGVITDKHLPAALNQRVQGLRLRKGIPMSNDFLFCVLNLDEFESLCIENASGSAQLNLSTIWVRDFQIICPPFDKQREFAQFANQADKSKYLS